MATTRVFYRDPIADGAKAQWTASAGADWQVLAKGVRSPTVPATTPTLTSSTNDNNTTVSFGTLAGLVNPGEFVNYFRLWVYAEGALPANHTVSVSVSRGGNGFPFGQSVGEVATTIQTGASGWFSTPKFSPVSQNGTMVSSTDTLEAALVLKEGAAQAANTTLTAAYLEVGVSTMDHVKPSGRNFVGVSQTSRTYNFSFAGFGNIVFDDWMIAGAEAVRQRVRDMKSRGLDLVRVFCPFGSRMTNETTVNETEWLDFEAFLQMCVEEDVRLGITGLVTFGTGTDHRPTWLDALSEANRWASFARWWKRCAQACAGSPAVVYYDLVNEPYAFNGGGSDWYTGGPPFDWATALCVSLGARTATQVRDSFGALMRDGASSNGIRSWDKVKPTGLGAGLRPFQPITDFSDAVPEAFGEIVLPHLYLWSQADRNAVLTQFEGLKATYNKPIIIEEGGALEAPWTVEHWIDVARELNWRGAAGVNGGWKGQTANFSTDASYKIHQRLQPLIKGKIVKGNRVAGVQGMSGRVGAKSI